MLWVLKLKDKLYKRKTKFNLTCIFQKVIRTFASRCRNIFDNSALCYNLMLGFKGGPTRGEMLQEHDAAKCSGEKIALSTH